MPKTHRVLNLSRNLRLKHSQALKAVDSCACAWVEYGVSIRDLTFPESLAARNEQARTREPVVPVVCAGALPFAELFGVVYRPTERNQARNREEVSLMRDANRFAQSDDWKAI